VSLLNHIITAPKPQPPKGIIYGPPGIGKTTFGASATNPIILDCENGAGNVACQRTPYLSDWDAIRGWLLAMETEQHPYKTVVIDSLDWMLRRVQESVCGVTAGKLDGTLNKAHGGYGNGKGVMANYVYQQVLPNLDRIVQRGIAVVLLAHARRMDVTDVDGVTVTKSTFEAPEEYVQVFTEWADFVCLARMDHASGERQLVTVDGDLALAKNRYALPPVLPFSWASFRDAVRAGFHAPQSQPAQQQHPEQEAN